MRHCGGFQMVDGDIQELHGGACRSEDIERTIAAEAICVMPESTILDCVLDRESSEVQVTVGKSPTDPYCSVAYYRPPLAWHRSRQEWNFASGIAHTLRSLGLWRPWCSGCKRAYGARDWLSLDLVGGGVSGRSEGGREVAIGLTQARRCACGNIMWLYIPFGKPIEVHEAACVFALTLLGESSA